jgi:acyl-CoA thioesterase
MSETSASSHITSQPADDAFAAFLGGEVVGLGNGKATASLEVASQHLNPHGTAHGAVMYSVVGTALAAAANDEEHSGVVSSVIIHYLNPAYPGDRLLATASLAERLPREDLFDIRLVRTSDDQVVARATGRATRRARTSHG